MSILDFSSSNCHQKREFVTNINVRGIIYSIYLWEDDAYKDEFPESLAHTTSHPAEIHFSKSHRDLITIKHELFHCFLASCFVGAWDTESSANLEEVACEVFSHFDEEIADLALSVEKKLNLTKGESSGDS